MKRRIRKRASSEKRPGRGKAGAMGLVIPKFDDMFHTYYITEVIRSVCRSAGEFGLDVLLHLTHKRVNSKEITCELENLSSCSGVLFADMQENEKLLDALVKKQIPCIVMNYYDRALSAGCIAIDNKGGAIKAVDHMIALGHRRVATITGDLKTQVAIERLEGYKESMKKNGLTIEKDLIIEGDFSPGSARKGIEKIFSLDSYPTAIFISSDEMAFEAVKFLQKKRIKVPQDMSIMGFDDSWFATQCPVALTTVKQPLDQMGRLAVISLEKMISSKKKSAYEKRVLQTELVIRESCVSPLRREDFY
ncbi:MAG: substrate-binding domain-containing protein [Candidatus Omnitrophica bacterium]|nr:substrate-binding domain-containing protein [Candidatus Omnitrophota bacterium]